MRRKVLQDFANVFCQRFIALPNGYDLATFARIGSGDYYLDVVSGECTHDLNPIPSLNTCSEYRDWLKAQLDKYGIPIETLQVTMRIRLLVSDIQVKVSFGHVFPSAFFEFNCYSEIRTAEKCYRAHHRGARAWGFHADNENLDRNSLKLPV